MYNRHIAYSALLLAFQLTSFNMGQLVGLLLKPVTSIAGILSGRRKRKRSSDSFSSDSEEYGNETQSPKKMKLLTTTQYIYQTLFKEQENSDISIMALEKVWKLHKVYLSQSPYFNSMFNGSWKESCESSVTIEILDDRITLDALDAVFGSMYSDEIEIEQKSVVSILATARLFHLESIIDKCADLMIGALNSETVVNYYEAACQYGCQNVKKSAFIWLETNILCIYAKNQNLLRQINIELMTALISSPDIYVIQTEFSLYALLRSWMYLHLHSNYDSENPQPDSNTSIIKLDIIRKYFTQRREKCSFLSTPEGQKYLKPFLALRTQHIIIRYIDLKSVLKDNIIPKEWLNHHFLSHWNYTLKVDHMPEDGKDTYFNYLRRFIPTIVMKKYNRPQNIEDEVFYKNCRRYGHKLQDSSYLKWRWDDFNFGLDLILIANSRVISIRRNHRNEHPRLLSLQSRRKFMIRASITSINSQRQPIFTQKSEIISLNLEKNEETVLMEMDNKLVYPILISVNLLVIPPTAETFNQNRVCDEFANASVPLSEIGANCGRSISPANNIDELPICVDPIHPNDLPIQPSRSTSSTSTVSGGSASSESSTDFG